MLIPWKEEFSVKIASIDEQHQKLLGLINSLHQAMLARKGKHVLGPVLDNLVAYTQEHFAYEEQLFERYEYPSRLSHIKEHKELVKKVADFQADFESGKLTVTMDVMQFLKDWLERHIQGTDKAYSAYLVRNGVK
jgi:hemerythrin-like metal-binding protein